MICTDARMLPTGDRIGQAKKSDAAMEPLERRVMLSTEGTGLSATYFDNPDFTGASVTRVDRKVYFDFASAPPPVAPTTFSVRWTGRIKPSFFETYTFYVTADDGVR